MGVSRIKALGRAIGKYLASRPNHVLVGFAAFSIIGGGTMLGFDLDARYHAALAAAEQSARSFAQVLAEHTARTFEAVDRTIGTAELIRRDADAGRYATAEAVHEDLRRLQQTSRALIAIGWTNAAGDVVAHSYEAVPPRAHIARSPRLPSRRLVRRPAVPLGRDRELDHRGLAPAQQSRRQLCRRRHRGPRPILLRQHVPGDPARQRRRRRPHPQIGRE